MELKPAMLPDGISESRPVFLSGENHYDRETATASAQSGARIRFLGCRHRLAGGRVGTRLPAIAAKGARRARLRPVARRMASVAREALTYSLVGVAGR